MYDTQLMSDDVFSLLMLLKKIDLKVSWGKLEGFGLLDIF